MQIIKPEWPAPASIVAFTTTRLGGVSVGAYAGLNVGLHVADDPRAVQQNRALLAAEHPAIREFAWLEQAHTTDVVLADSAVGASMPPCADASYTRTPGVACIVQTADCLPLLISNREGTVVAAVHAGWRGLAQGILENTFEKLQLPPQETLVWMGPAIGPTAFEVQDDVRQAFVTVFPELAQYFIWQPTTQRFLADLYGIARYRCHQAGIMAVYGGDHCTWTERNQFYSYRRDGQTGRMASVIYILER